MIYATHVGCVRLDILIGFEKCELTIKVVYYCAEMNTNLLSLETLVRNGLSFGVSHLLTNHLDPRRPKSTHGSMPAHAGTWDMNAPTALATWPEALTDSGPLA